MGRFGRIAARGAGGLFVTAGVVVLLFAAYQVWGVNEAIEAHQDQMSRQLEQQWQDPSSSVVDSGDPAATASSAASSNQASPGTGIGFVSIPKLGKRWAVVEGVAREQLRYYPGHYPGTAMPGEAGNLAIAGHRTQAIFFNLDRLAAGDEIAVETEEGRYVYRVTHVVIVAPDAVEVVGPVPPGESAGRLLTLTTCNPKFNNYQRLIVHASMEG